MKAARKLGLGHKKAWQRPTLPPSSGSTIGAAGLNFRVRDGNGWNPCAIVTRQNKLCSERRSERIRIDAIMCALFWRAIEAMKNMVKPHGKLVLVS